MNKMSATLACLLMKPYRLLFLAASVCLVIGAIDLHTSYEVKNYTETTGEICNVEPVRVLWHRRYVTRYNYDLVWYDGGEVYKKHYDRMFDMPQKGEVTIWVRPDNRNAVLSDSPGIKGLAVKILAVGFGAGVLGMILYLCYLVKRKESNKERTERLENTRIGGILGVIFGLVGMGFCIADVYKDHQAGKYTGVVGTDLVAVCGVVVVFSLILFIRAQFQLKKM